MGCLSLYGGFTMTMKVGLIGVGDISNKYVDNLKKYPHIVEVYGCAARNYEKTCARARVLGIPHVYESPEALLADSAIDIVLNLTTPDAHAKYNLAALKAGKHVYTEKPLAATFEEGRMIMELAWEKGLSVCCAPDTFLGGRVQAMRAAIDAGVIGHVGSGDVSMLAHGWECFHPNVGFYYRPGGGPALDMGPYYLTALVALLGPVEAVTAMTNRAQDTRYIPSTGEELPVEVDTHVAGVLKFRSGAIVNATLSFDVWDSARPRMELYGTKGSLIMPEPHPNSGPNIFGGKIALRKAEEFRWGVMPCPPGMEEKPFDELLYDRPFSETGHDRNSRGVGLIDQVRALQEKRPARADATMALHVLEVLEALDVAAKEERWIHMQTTCERPAPLPEYDPFAK